MDLSDSALGAKSQRALDSPERGSLKTLGNIEVKFPPLLHGPLSWKQAHDVNIFQGREFLQNGLEDLKPYGFYRGIR